MRNFNVYDLELTTKVGYLGTPLMGVVQKALIFCILEKSIVSDEISPHDGLPDIGHNESPLKCSTYIQIEVQGLFSIYLDD